jgi:hypothetical protein
MYIMNKIKLNPLRFLFIGMVVILIGAIAKITKETFYPSIFLIGLIIEFISIFLLLRKLDINIRNEKK